MVRGERLNKSGDSWFSPKTIEVVPRARTPGGRALLWLGGHGVLPNHGKLRIPGSFARETEHRVLTSGLKRESTQTAV